MAKSKKRKSKPLRAKRLPKASSNGRMQVEAATDNYIRSWREFRQCKSQEELARRTVEVDPKGVGLERVTICRLESGLTRYNSWHLDLIGKALTVAPRDLVGVNPFARSDFLAYCAGLSDDDKRNAIISIEVKGREVRVFDIKLTKKQR